MLCAQSRHTIRRSIAAAEREHAALEDCKDPSEKSLTAQMKESRSRTRGDYAARGTPPEKLLTA